MKKTGEKHYKKARYDPGNPDEKRLDEFVLAMEEAFEVMRNLIGSESVRPFYRSMGGYLPEYGKKKYIITAHNFSMKKDETEGLKKLKKQNALGWSVEAQVLKFADLFDEKTVSGARNRLAACGYFAD